VTAEPISPDKRRSVYRFSNADLGIASELRLKPAGLGDISRVIQFRSSRFNEGRPWDAERNRTISRVTRSP